MSMSRFGRAAGYPGFFFRLVALRLLGLRRRTLTARLHRDSSYAPVAYLSLFVALHVGFEAEVFAAMRAQLLGDKEFGFSNCLVLLDALLRLRHDEFSEEALDEIENLTQGTNEHSFAVAERIAAIRALRLQD
jgi:hypothetical protein